MTMSATGGLFEGVKYSKTTEQNPFKAVYAVREFIQEDIYRTKGMACAVEKGGSVLLVTWCGVVKQPESRDNMPIIMHRFSSKHKGEYKLKCSKVEENGSFSFLSFSLGHEGGSATSSARKEDWLIWLDLKSVGGESTSTPSELMAWTFYGEKPFKLTLKYDGSKKKYELKVADHSDMPKELGFLEMNSVLGSPIIVENGSGESNRTYSVVGVVGLSDDGQFFPYLITQEVIGEFCSSVCLLFNTP